MARRRRNPNWGGRRKGAGAPRRNVNALLHGRYSRQLREVQHLLARDDVRRLLSRLRRRPDGEQTRK